MRRLVLVLMVLGLGVACGGGGDDGGGAGGDAAAQDGGKAVPVVAKEYAFDPADLTAPAGEVSFELKNTGSLEHDLVIDEPKFTLKALASQTKTGKVTLEAGTYDFYCSVAGHKASGMKGTLTVS